MKYLILIQSNPRSRSVWEGLSGAQRVERGRARAALNEELMDSGEMIVSGGLADPSLAKRVMARGGRTVISDGPFAEAKEYLAGFYFIECESIERAVDVAARLPDATDCGVDIVPVLDRAGLEM